MQYFFSTVAFSRIVQICCGLFLVWVIACQQQSTVTQEEVDKPPSFGIVSGAVSDQQTEYPIPEATITHLDQTVTTDELGRYVLRQIPYGKNLLLSIQSIDYQSLELKFDLDQDYLPLNISLIRANDVEQEVNDYLTSLSNLVAGMKEVDKIEAHFALGYIVSDDVVTQFGVGTGVIPADFAEVRPTFKKLFEVYDRLLFQFHDVKIQVDYARQASAVLSLDVISERGRRRKRQEIQVKAKIDFQKENGVWQAYFLRLFEVNINL